MKKQIEKQLKCLTCKHWKNNQSELGYVSNSGICTSDKLRFTTTNYQSAYLLDRKNISDKYKGVQRFENTSSEVPIGKVERSQYCLVTDSEFGCINHSNK
jgi:hypothetical protein